MPDPWTDEKVVEAVARVICRAARKDPDLETPLGPLWIGYRPDARGALRAAAEAMAESGFVCVPREPSEAMTAVGGCAYDHPSVYMGGPSAKGRRTAERIYAAMLYAATLSATTPPAGETGE